MHRHTTFADFLDNAVTMGDEDAKGDLRLARTEILQLADEIGDREHPSNMVGANQKSTLEVYSGGPPTSGNYTLTLTLAHANLAITTGNLAWDDADSQIQFHLNEVCFGVIPGFVSGDIVVTGGSDLSANPYLLHFNGASVRREPWVVTWAVVDLTPGTLGVVTDTQTGTNTRRGYAVLAAGGVILDTTVPTTGAATGWTVIPLNENRGPFRLTNSTIRLIAKDISIHEGNPAIYTNLLSDLNITP